MTQPSSALARFQCLLRELFWFDGAYLGDRVTWLRSGAGPELALPPVLEFSVGEVYGAIGTMTRVEGGWELEGYTPTRGVPFYLRVRAPVRSGEGSPGLIQQVARFVVAEPPAAIFDNGFE